MDNSDIKRIVREEIVRSERFENSHGITLQNLGEFLVEPFTIRVDPDDRESSTREMWVVLQEYPQQAEGYSVVYDPSHNGWGVAERAGVDYVLICSAPTLAGALTSM